MPYRATRLPIAYAAVGENVSVREKKEVGNMSCWQREMAALIVQHQMDAYGYEADIEEILSHPKEWRAGWYQDALAWYLRRKEKKPTP
jgi:hypothetical protein